MTGPQFNKSTEIFAVLHFPATEHPVLVSDVVRLEEARGDGRHERRDAVWIEVHLSPEAEK